MPRFPTASRHNPILARNAIGPGRVEERCAQLLSESASCTTGQTIRIDGGIASV